MMLAFNLPLWRVPILIVASFMVGASIIPLEEFPTTRSASSATDSGSLALSSALVRRSNLAVVFSVSMSGVVGSAETFGAVGRGATSETGRVSTGALSGGGEEEAKEGGGGE